jgi:hypothetical protein
MYESVYKTHHPIVQDLNQAVEIARYQEKPIQSLSHDARLKDLPDRLKAALAELDCIRNAIFNAYADDKATAQSRCMPELVKICARRMLKIPTEIERKEKGFEFAQQRHDDKAETLKNMGYTSEQVANLLMDDAEATCKEKHEAELSALRKELGALNAFTRDCPNYDQRLLVGTPFENWKPENTGAFDKAAMALAQ